jgi:hypothetical protein
MYPAPRSERVLGFIPDPGFSVSGDIRDGGVLTLRSAFNRFGPRDPEKKK